MSNEFVFAYGSNLISAQMERRCPSAREIGIARLAGHRFAFTGYSPTWNGAVATVIGDRNDYVDGVVYSITPADLTRLDGFEGVPFSYTRRKVHVRIARRAIFAWVYIKAHTHDAIPSPAYFAACIAGRASRGIDYEPVIDAMTIATNGHSPLPF
jgi:gamma-glutamylcyclotransferase (GGCT)/AIG2-like uncharacterized protein YtfP